MHERTTMKHLDHTAEYVRMHEMIALYLSLVPRWPEEDENARVAHTRALVKAFYFHRIVSYLVTSLVAFRRLFALTTRRTSGGGIH
jgi:hypothetical protein